ncbi:hypothetical protein ACMX2H_07260 [Arthrobacter sulfonylureivorans]|uniref:hypothetical protein n=1 Tax=Arthrobacter sulfonylureivorans TaxID=2486855 RepID=UPI0039E46C0A
MKAGNVLGRGAAAALCLALVSGCGLLPTNDAGASPSAGASPAVVAGGAASPGPGAAKGPVRQATIDGWKVYTDPDRVLSFEIPADWVVQRQVKPSQPSDNGLHLDIRDSSGKLAAELHTRLKLPKDTCSAGGVTELRVLLSEPAKVPAVASADTVDPVFVYRTLLGYKYFGSYGLTDKPAGNGFQACTVENTVNGPKSVGTYSFATAVRHGTPAPGEKTGLLDKYGLIAEAERFITTKHFKTVQQVIMTLQISGDAPA